MHWTSGLFGTSVFAFSKHEPTIFSGISKKDAWRSAAIRTCFVQLKKRDL